MRKPRSVASSALPPQVFARHSPQESNMSSCRFLVLFVIAASMPAADRPVVQLSLRRAVEIATSPEGSARIQIATELTRQADARSTQARAALLPSIDGSVSQ